MILKAKAALREKISAQIAELSLEEKKSESEVVGKMFLALPEFQKAKVVGFYASDENEIETDALIEKSLELGKRIAIPRVENKTLDWREIRSLADLELGEFGLRHPQKNSPAIDLNTIDLLVVPGVAFTTEGDRLGRGWGCYDKTLAEFRGETIALAFATQLEQKIPTQPHDKRVSKVLVKD
jgi:5-formyltetrahydrofolate cyclo-ligase